jgi:hypothetical protein
MRDLEHGCDIVTIGSLRPSHDHLPSPVLRAERVPGVHRLRPYDRASALEKNFPCALVVPREVGGGVIPLTAVRNG